MADPFIIMDENDLKKSALNTIIKNVQKIWNIMKDKKNEKLIAIKQILNFKDTVLSKIQMNMLI